MKLSFSLHISHSNNFPVINEWLKFQQYLHFLNRWVASIWHSKSSMYLENLSFLNSFCLKTTYTSTTLPCLPENILAVHMSQLNLALAIKCNVRGALMTVSIGDSNIASMQIQTQLLVHKKSKTRSSVVLWNISSSKCFWKMTGSFQSEGNFHSGATICSTWSCLVGDSILKVLFSISVPRINMVFHLPTKNTGG